MGSNPTLSATFRDQIKHAQRHQRRRELESLEESVQGHLGERETNPATAGVTLIVDVVKAVLRTQGYASADFADCCPGLGTMYALP